ncbi:L10-interacting MYB domain-containing protein-like [Brachypodium distachyon]|uniref:Myb/SANT-like domain-containing protein n=1 Tax=Brachypodium distachyon TaxID=15368 RepID=A0A2K2D9U7_BRADI|nr:L10-interacting MYB domain-containing protein-like [Brachypodium distachyon]PNT71062.1 hypothetical protein BRADI_2g22446v3 [Brachypodium distachyon]|eukprot:XP_024315719.1 L10-interacting MYB domain-containing protein-like [Brachypodium distachyon]
MAAINWNDDNTRIITELFADQVHRENRPNSHLNNVAYEEISQRFKDKTGIESKKTQIKNKWDKLKNEYDIWKKLLLEQTGAGWEGEPSTRTSNGGGRPKWTFLVVEGFKTKVFVMRTI